MKRKGEHVWVLGYAYAGKAKWYPKRVYASRVVARRARDHENIQEAVDEFGRRWSVRKYVPVDRQVQRSRPCTRP